MGFALEINVQDTAGSEKKVTAMINAWPRLPPETSDYASSNMLVLVPWTSRSKEEESAREILMPACEAVRSRNKFRTSTCSTRSWQPVPILSAKAAGFGECLILLPDPKQRIFLS